MFTTSVRSIVGDLEKKVRKLQAHADKLRAKSEYKRLQAASLVDESESHDVEAEHARRVAEKVRAILD